MTHLQQIDRNSRCVLGLAEYIWITGNSLKSMTKVIEVYEAKAKGDWVPQVEWVGITNQGEEAILSPCYYIEDPIRGEQCYLVLCEVRNADASNHEANYRAKLRGTLDAGASDLYSHWTFEQRFCLVTPMNETSLYGGREQFEMFAQACLQGSLHFGGGRTHKMSGGWSFQMGIRDFDNDPDILNRASIETADHLIFARWILHRLFEDHSLSVDFSPVPEIGMLSAFFSTEMMRHPANGRHVIHNMASAIRDEDKEPLREPQAIDPVEKVTVMVPLKTEQTGQGPIKISMVLENDPYRFINRVLLQATGLEYQVLADEDQERYEKLGLTVIQGGPTEP